MLVYGKSLARLKELDTVWREPKPGAQEIWNKYLDLREKHGSDNSAIEADLQKWYRGLPKNHPSKSLSRYRHVDENGPWRDRDISWPGGGGNCEGSVVPGWTGGGNCPVWTCPAGAAANGAGARVSSREKRSL
jgi:hypothetical protein